MRPEDDEITTMDEDEVPLSPRRIAASDLNADPSFLLAFNREVARREVILFFCFFFYSSSVF